LFNFSSDTLFSTHCFEDQRDPVGTNPDLFQPDLLHLYPNFLDFGDVDSFGFNDFSSTSNTAGLLTTPNQLKLTQYPSVTHSPKIIGKQINRSISSPFNPPTLNKIEITNHQQQQHQHQHQQSLNQPEHISRRNLQNSSKLKSIINNNNSTLESSPSSSSSSSSSPSQSKQQQQQQQAAGFSVDSYYNFNTLATVAAASPSISPARSSQLNQLEELMPSTSTLTSNRSNTTTTVTNSTIRNLLALNSSSLVKEINQSSLKEMLTSTEKPNLIADNTNNNNPQIRDLLNSSILSPKNSDKIHGHHHHHHHHHQNQHQSQVVTQSSKKRGRKSNSTKAAEEAAAAAAAAVAAAVITSSSYKSHLDDVSLSSEQQIVPTKTSRSNNLSKAKIASSSSSSSSSISSSCINNKASQNTLAKQSSKSLNKMDEEEQPSILNSDNIQMSLNPQYHQIQQHQQQQHYQLQYRNFKKQFIIENSDNIHTLQSSLNFNNSPSNTKQQQFQTQITSDNLILNTTSPTGTDASCSSPLSSSSSNYMNNLNIKLTLPTLLPTGSSKASKFNQVPASPSTSSNIGQEFLNFVAASTTTTSAGAGPSSRLASRSNSVTSNTTSFTATNDANLSSAEQKRRCNIQHGFDHLQTLVPALGEGGSKNSGGGKASKAAMLQKTSEYIRELKMARESRLKDLNVYKREIELLSDKISECQNQLPANGVSCCTGQLNSGEKLEQKFNAYVKAKTVENWRFYLFSLILRPLFENFVTTLNTSSKEDMERTFYEWQQKYCNLTQLRPIASNALRQLSKSTSILSNSAKLPEECYSAALTRI
jgi:MAX-like protein X